MQIRPAVLALAALAAGAGAADGQVDIWNGTTYEVTPFEMTWWDAESWAVSERGGHLVSLGSEAEEVFVQSLLRSTLGSDVVFYMGLNDVAEEDVFVWSDGSPVTYLNWRTGTGEPNNYYNEDYVTGNVGPYYQWNDEPGSTEYYAVVEYTGVVPEPATMLLLVTGLAGVAGAAGLRRRRG